MNTPLIRRPDSNGASAEAVPAVPAVPAAAGASDGYLLPATWRGIGAQAAAALGMLTGLWVAISPWFITLQYAGGNATAVNLISGLAVAAVGAFALAGPAVGPVHRVGDGVLVVEDRPRDDQPDAEQRAAGLQAGEPARAG